MYLPRFSTFIACSLRLAHFTKSHCVQNMTNYHPLQNGSTRPAKTRCINDLPTKLNTPQTNFMTSSYLALALVLLATAQAAVPQYSNCGFSSTTSFYNFKRKIVNNNPVLFPKTEAQLQQIVCKASVGVQGACATLHEWFGDANQRDQRHRCPFAQPQDYALD